MIKHEKIAARLSWLCTDEDREVAEAVYRLSKPLTYGPAIERTWFVHVHGLGRKVILTPSTQMGEPLWDFILVCDVLYNNHAEALDALGYELIEEET